MKANMAELNALLDEITAAIGEILATHSQLQLESISTLGGTDGYNKKLDSLKKQTELVKDRLKKHREAVKRQQGLDRIRKKNSQTERRGTGYKISESAGMKTLLGSKGQLIGRVRSMGRGRADFLSPSGRVVARETPDGTWDVVQNKKVSRQRMGMAVLGHYTPKLEEKNEGEG